VIDEETLERALERQRESGEKLGHILIEHHGVGEERIAETLAEQKGMEHVRLSSVQIDRDAVAEIPARLAQKQNVIPIAVREGNLVLAMADPLDVEAMDEVRLTSGRPVLPVVATPSEISHAIQKYMVAADAFHDVETAMAEQTAAQPEVEETTEDVPIVRLVNQLIQEAVMDRASDIHIEPGEDDVRVRYRVDGVLQEVTRLPRQARAGITSRIKVMADMDIAERRLPQDGRSAVVVDGTPADLRVASLPTPHGEAITIRILHDALAFRSLERLGMTDEDQDTIRKLLARPYGAILHAGPTGSGKTTSLYAGLSHLNETERKIITVEDPIEYRMEGITQMAVRSKIGLTFAAGLRTILRADPDVVMIGEMRDPETAEIGIRAALTGHLVLSSIHTNDAPSALTRLLDMGVPPYITSSALLGVVAQRLVRRLCPECKEEHAPSEEELAEAGVTPDEAALLPRVHIAVGCDRCANTGYRGRVGLYEIMTVSDEVRRLFLHEAPSEELRDTALRQGMKSLRRDGIEKVAQGLTTLEEVARAAM
jgi:type IV pilus assembly protein PilB